ncbi:hypothetical protein ABZ721_32460 [Streptomyces sp. NPDC006733]|uniref:hypothetical protein n=1 Tax=Streptomyces sp. NPDC006733 TaxID=3155460 RepID=UPI003410698F
MPTDDLPADLIACQAAFQDADAVVAAYIDTIDKAPVEPAANPEPAPGDGAPAQKAAAPVQEPAPARKVWNQDQQQELKRLRSERMAALKALWGHPTVVKAMAEGNWMSLHTRLKKEVGAPGWTR